jgi:NAD+ kinase
VTIRRIGIVAKHGLTAAAPHLTGVVAWLADRGVDVRMDSETAAIAGTATVPTVSRDELPREVDLLLVLGGDGTLLGVADAVGAAGVRIPILGVNFGRLGFLTEVTLSELFPTLEEVLAGRAQVHERRMLRARTIVDGAIEDDQLVLNDVVVTRGAISRVIDLGVTVDGGFVTRVKGDGIILASPTGSTAYNLAANGPIIHPEVDAIVLTPIAPHTLANRPIVIPGSSTIDITPLDETRQLEVFVTFDGRSGRLVAPGDLVRVTRAAEPVCLVSSATRSYYDTLREKLGWGEKK